MSQDVQVLEFSASVLAEPLTTLPSPEAEGKAMRLQTSIQLFVSTLFDATACDYHVLLAQSAIQQVCM